MTAPDVQGINSNSARELLSIAADIERLWDLPCTNDAEREAVSEELNLLCVRAARVVVRCDPKMMLHPSGPYQDDTRAWLNSWGAATLALANKYPHRIGSVDEFGSVVPTNTVDNRSSFPEWPPKVKPGGTAVLRVVTLAYPNDSAARIHGRIRDHAKACRLFAELIGQECDAFNGAEESPTKPREKMVPPVTSANEEWLTPTTKADLANRLGNCGTRKVTSVLRQYGLRQAGNRQQWTCRIDTMPKNMRQKLERPK